MEPEDLAVIGHTGDLLVDIYARNLTHIYILPQCSTTAARVLNPAGMDAQFERLRCAISRGILNFPSSSFGKSGELLMPLFNEILGVMGVPSNVISSALSGLTGVVTKENASTDAYYVSCEFSLLEEARFDKIETGLPIVFQLDHNSNYTGYSDYASSTEIMYRTYFKPHSANKGTYYYTSCEDTFIPFQITLPE